MDQVETGIDREKHGLCLLSLGNTAPSYVTQALN